METKGKIWPVFAILGAAALWATLLMLIEKYHDREIKRMTICEVGGGTINRSGECLPGTARGRQ